MKAHKQTIHITQRLMDAKGTCKDHTVQRIVRPYGTSDHYVSFKGQTVLVKQYTNTSGWYGTFY
jgi:hypothetical protein